MPNYIKNRLTLSGDQLEIQNLVDEFSTFYPEEQHESYDGKKTFVKDGIYGWLDEEKGEFNLRGELPTNFIPEGFEPHKNPEWTRFPDFDKIVPMPESLNLSSDSWLSPLENQFSRNTLLKDHLDRMREYMDSNPGNKEETMENFIKGIRNYIDYGHSTWYSWSNENWGTKWNSSYCHKVDDSTFEFETAWSGVPELIEKIGKRFPSVNILYEFSDEDTGSNCGSFIFHEGSVESRIPDNRSKEAYDLAFKIRPESLDRYELVDGNYEYKED